MDMHKVAARFYTSITLKANHEAWTDPEIIEYVNRQMKWKFGKDDPGADYTEIVKEALKQFGVTGNDV